jgi:hypothetical protein
MPPAAPGGADFRSSLLRLSAQLAQVHLPPPNIDTFSSTSSITLTIDTPCQPPLHGYSSFTRLLPDQGFIFLL